MFESQYGKRITIRPFRLEDADALQQAIAESRDHLRPWLPFADAHQTVEESQHWIMQAQADWQQRDDFPAGIWRHADGQFLGGIGLHPRNWNIRYFMVGYWLRASATGRGYMVEAVRLLTDFALKKLDAQRVEIICSAHNTRSATVARRAGYVYEGTLRNDHKALNGKISSSMVFSVVPGDWKADPLSR
jgi:RimJ/RimL family protein N-acetyltransferase